MAGFQVILHGRFWVITEEQGPENREVVQRFPPVMNRHGPLLGCLETSRRPMWRMISSGIQNSIPFTMYREGFTAKAIRASARLLQTCKEDRQRRNSFSPSI